MALHYDVTITSVLLNIHDGSSETWLEDVKWRFLMYWKFRVDICRWFRSFWEYPGGPQRRTGHFDPSLTWPGSEILALRLNYYFFTARCVDDLITIGIENTSITSIACLLFYRLHFGPYWTLCHIVAANAEWRPYSIWCDMWHCLFKANPRQKDDTRLWHHIRTSKMGPIRDSSAIPRRPTSHVIRA